MQIIEHRRDGSVVAEVAGLDEKIADAGTALDVLASAQYSTRTNRVILHAGSLDTTFFDLKTGLAGEILQKVSNYNLRLAIIGDFTNVESRALRAFIDESNRHGQVLFVGDLEAAVSRLC
jgi:hypothetical protein